MRVRQGAVLVKVKYLYSGKISEGSRYRASVSLPYIVGLLFGDTFQIHSTTFRVPWTTYGRPLIYFDRSD